MEDKLKDFLDEYLPWVDYHIPTFINAGGCAFFAKGLALSLHSMGIEYKIYALFMKDDPMAQQSMSNMEAILKGAGEKEMTESHVMVKVRDYYYDSRGARTLKDGKYDNEAIIGKLQIHEELLDEQLEDGSWSEIFDKSQVKEINKLLSNIPDLIKDWKKGEYKVPPIDEKKINSYTHVQLALDRLTSQLS